MTARITATAGTRLPRTLEIGSRSLWPLASLATVAVVTLICIIGAIMGQSTQRKLRSEAVAAKRAVEQARLVQVALSVRKRSAAPVAAVSAAGAATAPTPPIVAVAAPAPAASAIQVAQAAPIRVQAVQPVAVRRPAPPKAQVRPIAPATAPVQVAQASPVPDDSRARAQAYIQAKAQSAQPPLQAKLPPEKVTAEMVDSAKKSNKIEGFSGEKLGVSKIENESVFLKNGGSIKIGERFPSGEILLHLDPGNGQIVTSKRTLLVF